MFGQNIRWPAGARSRCWRVAGYPLVDAAARGNHPAGDRRAADRRWSEPGGGAETETVSNSLGRALALQSDAVWAISEGVVSDDLAAGRLVRLPVDMGAGPIGITTRTAADTISCSSERVG